MFAIHYDYIEAMCFYYFIWNFWSQSAQLPYYSEASLNQHAADPDKKVGLQGVLRQVFFKYRRNWPVVFESTDFEGVLILRDLGIEKKNHLLSCFMQLHISENN